MRTELGYALRALARDRGFAATVVLSLAVGIGANTAIFSLVDGILLRAPQYREPDRLVTLSQVIPKFAKSYPSVPTNIGIYMEWRKQAASFESIGIAQANTFNMTGVGQQPEQVTGAIISAGLFGVFGVQPALGRTFTNEEEQKGHDRVVILAYSLWRRRFQADRAVIGRKVLLDGRPYEVVGVLPASFTFPRQEDIGNRRLDAGLEVYRPLGYDQRDTKVHMGDFNYWGTARLKPGATLSRAQAEIDVIAAAIDKQIPGNFDIHVALQPLQERMIGKSRDGLVLMMAAVGAVLLVLCVNLANLSLARAAGRGRDAAIRTALGASRGRLIRQSLAESLVLAVIGGALGVGLAYWGVSALVAAAPLDLPRLGEVHMDARVLLFGLAVSILTGAAFGILPALRNAAASPIDAMKSGSRSNTESRGGVRLRNVLVGVEVGLSAALLVTAGLLIASFARVMTIDRGFRVERVLAVDVSLLYSKYSEDPPRVAFYERLLAKAQATGGVQSASVVSALPLSGETWIDLIGTEHDTRLTTELPASNVRFISPGYFETLHVSLREGRDFEDRDRKQTVAIVSQSLAQRLWGAANPIGRKLTENDRLLEVVGVTPDFRSTSLEHEPVNMLYVPFWQRPRTSGSLLVRTAMDPKQIAGAMRSAVWELDPEAVIPAVRTLEEVMSASVAQRRFQALLVMLFAAAALGLAAIGAYGVLSYSVTRRTNEMGIRMALGAKPGDVMGMVLRQGMLPVLVGLVAGGVVALAVGRYLQSLLFQVSPRDPVAFGVSAGVLLAVSVAACLIPARRATRVNPVEALRFE